MRPPRLALWVLDRFLSSPHRDAIAGDLVQRHVAGASNWWVWRQVIGAIAIVTLTHLRARPLQVIGATCIGWATMESYVRFVATTSTWLHMPHDRWIIFLMMPLAGYAASGWIVGRLAGLPAMWTYFVVMAGRYSVSAAQMIVWIAMKLPPRFSAPDLFMFTVFVGVELAQSYTLLWILAGGLAGSRRRDAKPAVTVS